MTRRRKAYHFYSGDDFPMVAALKGVTLFDVHRVEDLLTDLGKNPFPYDYVFIEPSYNALHDFQNSSSQHPLADVRAGEALVKTVYEGLRASPIWESSLFIVTWDEHGGFYDHVAPPRAVAPGDTPATCKYNQSGFTFEQYGVRTPAIVVSPWIPRGTIDHRVYGHASVPEVRGSRDIRSEQSSSHRRIGLSSFTMKNTRSACSPFVVRNRTISSIG
jgi:phospholipase C